MWVVKQHFSSLNVFLESWGGVGCSATLGGWEHGHEHGCSLEVLLQHENGNSRRVCINSLMLASCYVSDAGCITSPVCNTLLYMPAGDDVDKKKPDPKIYNVAAQKLGLDPSECLVVEDSTIGLQAALGAGMRCIITYTPSTKQQVGNKGCA